MKRSYIISHVCLYSKAHHSQYSVKCINDTLGTRILSPPTLSKCHKRCCINVCIIEWKQLRLIAFFCMRGSRHSKPSQDPGKVSTISILQMRKPRVGKESWICWNSNSSQVQEHKGQSRAELGLKLILSDSKQTCHYSKLYPETSSKCLLKHISMLSEVDGQRKGPDTAHMCA